MMTKKDLLERKLVQWFLNHEDNDLDGKTSIQWWGADICRSDGRAHRGFIQDLFIAASEVLEELNDD